MGLMNPLHLAFVGAVALIVLGPKRLPEIARSIGRGMREFREALNSEAEQHEHDPARAVESTPPVPPVEPSE